jgi:hypothetical protein
MEDYFCGENNLVLHQSPHTCTIGSWTSDSQNFMDWVFEQARRSTIRFSHAILEHSVLPILLEHTSTASNRSGGQDIDSTIDGREYNTFEHFFRQDTYGTGPSVRQHQEWDNCLTRANLSFYLVSGIDWLISMRNNDTNSVVSDMSYPSCSGVLPSNSIWPNTNGEGYDRAQLAKDVVTLLHTPLQRFGSKIREVYKNDLRLQIHRLGELGFDDYRAHLLLLTNQSSDLLNGAPQNTNVYKGTVQETSSARTYHSTIASIALASLVPINDAIWMDRAGYWTSSGNQWTGRDIHPDPTYFKNGGGEHLLFSETFTLAYQENSVYTDAALCAQVALVPFYPPPGQKAPLGEAIPIFDLDKDEVANYGSEEEPVYQEENQYATRSHGFTFSRPPVDFTVGPSQSNWYEERRVLMWKTLPEFLNPLFHQYDGFKSHAVKQTTSLLRYLPNQFVDSVPTNIGWQDIAFDTTCFSYLSNCGRDDTNGFISPCAYTAPP